MKLRLKPKKDRGLRSLLEDAIKQGLLVDAGFKRWIEHQKAFRRIHYTETASAQSLVATLLDVAPSMRNAVAHGNRILHDEGFLHLDIVCDAIDQIFPEQK